MSTQKTSQNIIEVSMGEGAVASHPYVLTSAGLGSCVVVALYDTRRMIGGTAHIMLPRYSGSGNNGKYAYADTAIENLLEEMLCKGAKLPDIVAKLTGGARMFSCGEESECLGDQNCAKLRDVLVKKGIHIAGEDTGGSHGRSVEFYLDTGEVVVRSLEKGDKVL